MFCVVAVSGVLDGGGALELGLALATPGFSYAGTLQDVACEEDEDAGGGLGVTDANYKVKYH